jgi:N-methylhydantoinase B
LPSIPHGVWVNQGQENERYLGSLFSGVPLQQGDTVQRPSAGGGGLGDPLKRDPEAVLSDVVEGYVSVARAKKDYGVVVEEVDADLAEYRLDEQATLAERARIASHRKAWLDESAEKVAARYRAGELDMFDLIRQYGVIVDWGSGELLAQTTEAFRDMLKRRTVPYWSADQSSKATLKVA